MFMGS